MSNTCASCGFWSKWLPSSGDCLLHAYTRRNALLSDKASEPPRPADMTDEGDTCDRWAPVAEVTEFVHGGAEPPTWATAKATTERAP